MGNSVCGSQCTWGEDELICGRLGGASARRSCRQHGGKVQAAWQSASAIREGEAETQTSLPSSLLDFSLLDLCLCSQDRSNHLYQTTRQRLPHP